LRRIGLESERLVDRGAGIVVAPQREARDGAAEPGLGIASRQRQGLVVGGDRLLVAGEVVERGGATSQLSVACRASPISNWMRPRSA
jgi:hypothetical protein